MPTNHMPRQSRAKRSMLKTMTHQEIARCFDLLERRLRLVRQLASTLEQGQTALVTMDAEQIEQQVNDQQALCQEWRLVEHEIQVQYRTSPASRQYATAPRRADSSWKPCQQLP